jgi:hypothetical protein
VKFLKVLHVLSLVKGARKMMRTVNRNLTPSQNLGVVVREILDLRSRSQTIRAHIFIGLQAK